MKDLSYLDKYREGHPLISGEEAMGDSGNGFFAITIEKNSKR